MMEFVLTEFKKTKLQSDFSFSTIIQLKPLHHRFVCRIIDNICDINSKSSQMIIPVSIFIIYVDLYLLIELIMNKKIKNKTGITITPLYNRSLQISRIYLGRIFFSRVERPYPNWICTIVENYFRFFGLSTNSKCHIRIGFSKEIIISFAHLKIDIFQSDLRIMA